MTLSGRCVTPHVFTLTALWYGALRQQGGTLGWVCRPWYRTKTAVAFPDLLIALQQDRWRARVSAAPAPTRRPQKPTARQLCLDLRAA